MRTTEAMNTDDNKALIAEAQITLIECEPFHGPRTANLIRRLAFALEAAQATIERAEKVIVEAYSYFHADPNRAREKLRTYKKALASQSEARPAQRPCPGVCEHEYCRRLREIQAAQNEARTKECTCGYGKVSVSMR